MSPKFKPGSLRLLYNVLGYVTLQPDVKLPSAALRQQQALDFARSLIGRATAYFCACMKSLTSAAISSALVSSAKWPASRTWTSASGTSLR
jgi:hypothetical protein